MIRVDPEVYLLACYFTDDAKVPVPDTLVWELARHIQQCIEDYLENEEFKDCR